MPHDHHPPHQTGHRHAHGAGHAHAHGHAHVHAPASFGRAFAIGTALNLGFVAVEAIFGVMANSVALLADAGHNLSDVLGLLLAWGAAWLSARLPTRHRTYGYKKSSVLASLINAVVLLIAVGAIAWEAARRLASPEPVEGGIVLWVAAIGIVVNGVTAWLFMAGRHADINIRGAFLHMAADAAVSLGVVVAALVIGWTGWLWLDPAVSLAIVAVITVGTWGLLRGSLNMAMDAVPDGLDPSRVREHLEETRGVREIHDLHIWAMSTTETALTCHLVMPGGHPSDDEMACIVRSLHDEFGIAHATLQVETGAGAAECVLAPDHVV
jgi:cobalt-zinc-cadmium efflux system protein